MRELGPNGLDMQGVGSNQTVNGFAWNCYDRLMTYAPKTLPDGTVSYDRKALAPELAESWQIASDGMSCTFNLRKDATFHDGTPVTAKDVKWSFDRSVSVSGFPTFQMSAGSLEKPDQFVVVDDHTFRVDFIRKDKMLMFNLAVVVPFVINSALAKKNATEADPWAMNWLRSNEAGGGALSGRKLAARQRNHSRAFRQLEKRTAAEDQACDRPRCPVARHAPRHARARRCRYLDRISAEGFRPDDQGGQGQDRWRADPECALVRRAQHLARRRSTTSSCARRSPGRCPTSRSRRARSSAARSRCMAAEPAVEQAAWPQPFPYRTDLDKREGAACRRPGSAQGFDTSFALDVGTATVGEPTAVLIQESLAKIGVRITIEKIPGANWRTTLNKKELPMVLNRFSGWLDYPEYYFFWNLHGNNSIFNISGLQERGDGPAHRSRPLHRRPSRVRKEREGLHRALHAGGADHPAQPADPRRRDAEGGRRLRVLVPPRTRTSGNSPRPDARLQALHAGLVANSVVGDGLAFSSWAGVAKDAR